MRSPRPGSARSPSSSGARRRPATSAPTATSTRIAPAYEAAGARAMSVLVDERFGGTWDDLRAARATVALPLLAKGFFSTPEHLRQAREAGADAALLLLRDLDDAACAALLAEAEALGLDTLVEAHDADEMRRAVALGAPVIGVNARDLSTFAIDRSAQLELLALVPRDRVLIAESGIATAAQAAAAELAGANAVLVGSTLMRAPDPGAALREILRRPLVKVCGLTRQDDVDAAVEAGADLVGFILARARAGRRRCSTHPTPCCASRCSSARPSRPTPTSSSTTRPTAPTARAMPPCSAAASASAPSSTCRGCRTTRRTSSGPARPRAASCSPAGSGRRTSPRRSRRCGRGRSTRRGRPSWSRA